MEKEPTGRFASPHELAAASLAGKLDRESPTRRPIAWYQANTGHAAQLFDPEGAGGELAADASLPSAPCIALRVLATLCKPVLLLAAEDSSTCVLQYFAVFYLIWRSGTKS